jgi:hypothetical protein
MANSQMKIYLGIAFALLTAALIWKYRSDFLEIGIFAKQKSSQLSKVCE